MPAVRPPSTSPILTLGTGRTSSRRRLIWLSLAVLLWPAIVIYRQPRGGDSSLFSKIRSHIRTSNCEDDLYSQPGYIYRGEAVSDIRWIPYHNSVSANATIDYESPVPPSDAMQEAVPSYAGMLQSADRASDPRLEFLRGRTIVAVGDSHDRYNVLYFCEQQPNGKIDVVDGHKLSYCYFPDLELTIAAWFHFGMSDEAWYSELLSQNDDAPFAVEDRIDAIFKTHKIGKPDLIIMNTGFWDFEFFSMSAAHRGKGGTALHSNRRPLLWSELAYHRRRVKTYIEKLQSSFPGVALMFRLSQALENNAGGRNVGLYQLNESIRAVLRDLRVPVFPWAELLTGEQDYKDDQHFNAGKPAWLFGDMALYYLHRAVNGISTC